METKRGPGDRQISGSFTISARSFLLVWYNYGLTSKKLWAHMQQDNQPNRKDTFAQTTPPTGDEAFTPHDPEQEGKFPGSKYPRFSFGDEDELENESLQEGIQTTTFSLPVDHAGTNVYVKGWLQTTRSKASIVIVHDICENLNLYREAAKLFVANHFNVYCYDMRGHGRSGRMLGHVDEFQHFVNDLLQVVAWVRHESGGITPFVLGQGIGAIVALHFQQRFNSKVPGYILSAPTLALKLPTKAFKRVFVRGLSDLVPTLRLPSSLAPKCISEIGFGKEASVFHEKPPVYQTMSVQLANQLITTIDNAQGRFLRFKGKALILLATKDELVDTSVFENLYMRHKKRENLTILNLADTGHNIFTDDINQMNEAVSKIISWLNENMADPNES